MPRLKTPCLTNLSLLLSLLVAGCAHTSPEDAQMAASLCAQGKTLLAAGKNAEARDMYASAAQRDPESARAWNGLGVADELIGSRDDAGDAYQEAIDLDPDDLTATNNLAHLYVEMGRPDDAIALLQPYSNDPKAPPAMRQNLDAALKAAATRQAVQDSYADLGSFPTSGMAQAHMNEARQLLGDDAQGLTFTVDPEVKIAGGTPLFTAKVTGKPPQVICDALNPKAFPCVPVQKGAPLPPAATATPEAVPVTTVLILDKNLDTKAKKPTTKTAKHAAKAPQAACDANDPKAVGCAVPTAGK